MNLIESLGGINKAKQYLKWMEREGLLMGSYPIDNGIASFYDVTLRKAIEKYEMEMSNGC
jgi:hypothetical protein